MKTQLMVRWQRETGFYNEEVIEREDDGILLNIFTHVVGIMHQIEKLEKEKVGKEIEKEKLEVDLVQSNEHENMLIKRIETLEAGYRLFRKA